MQRKDEPMSRSILLGAATAIAMTAAIPHVPALAQGEADRADSSAITVYAPLREQTRRSSSGVGTERVLTSSSSVYYDDLNLHTQWGRDQLDDRIKLAAEQTCDYLEDLYPLDSSSTSSFECVKKAVRDARPQVYLAVANFDGGYAYNDYCRRPGAALPAARGRMGAGPSLKGPAPVFCVVPASRQYSRGRD